MQLYKTCNGQNIGKLKSTQRQDLQINHYIESNNIIGHGGLFLETKVMWRVDGIVT